MTCESQAIRCQPSSITITDGSSPFFAELRHNPRHSPTARRLEGREKQIRGVASPRDRLFSSRRARKFRSTTTERLSSLLQAHSLPDSGRQRCIARAGRLLRGASQKSNRCSTGAVAPAFDSAGVLARVVRSLFDSIYPASAPPVYLRSRGSIACSPASTMTTRLAF